MGGGTTNLPPGFHFHPSDEELIVQFLHRKASLLPCYPDIIPTVHLHHHDPWDLNGKALKANDKWYFFKRLTRGRGSSNGYWSQVGLDEPVFSSGRNVGSKKTLTFYIGDPAEGVKTNWVMHEFHLVDGSTSSRSMRKRGNSSMECNKWVVCQVYDSSSSGPQAGFRDEGTELSCLDEVFLSLDDLDEVSLPN